MLEHDKIHMITINNIIMTNQENIFLTKNLYYNILNSNLDIQHKELFIFLIFINIHEMVLDKIFTFNEDFEYLCIQYIIFFNNKFF